MMTLLDILQARLPMQVKRTANSDGGEYHSACPKCGGEDRFMFWPEAGNFYCRQCGWRGDGITILREIDGLSFREAKRLVKGDDLPAPAKPSPARTRLALLRAAFLAWHERNLARIVEQYQATVAELFAVEALLGETVLSPDLAGMATVERWHREYDRLNMEEHALLVAMEWWGSHATQPARVLRWDRERLVA